MLRYRVPRSLGYGSITAGGVLLLMVLFVDQVVVPKPKGSELLAFVFISIFISSIYVLLGYQIVKRDVPKKFEHENIHDSNSQKGSDST